MRDRACIELVRWAAGELALRPEGFRRVRRQVCKHLVRRMAELNLDAPDAYRAFVRSHAEERPVLEGLCRVHVSRFHRDGPVFEALRQRVLPELARAVGGGSLRVWSAGCAAGEEPYTIALLWHLAVARQFPDCRLEILATDADPASLERARRACYSPSSLRELPRSWREQAFLGGPDGLWLRPELRAEVELRCEDLRREMPVGPFHLILCRNLAFTYFAEDVQREVAGRLTSRLAPGGVLLIGARERLPIGPSALVADGVIPGLFRAPPA